MNQYQRCTKCERIYHLEDFHTCPKPPYGLPFQIHDFSWIEVNENSNLSLYENENYNYSTLENFFACELINISAFLFSVHKKLQQFVLYPSITITFKDITGVTYAEKIEFQHEKIEINTAEDIISALDEWKVFIFERARGCKISERQSSYQCVEKVSFILKKNHSSLCGII